MQIPTTGTDHADVLAQLEAKRQSDVDWHDGKTLAYVFHASPEVSRLAEEAFRSFMWENALDPTVIPSLMKIETEIVAMAAAHLRGDEAVVGNFTSGGTESVMLAVKSARDHARTHRPEIERPQMVLPETAHPCFHKGAHYFGVEPIVVPVDPTTGKVPVEAMRAAITRDTILLVGSAPSYPQGAIDPITELGQLAIEHDLLLHVDGCIGGFLLPFFRELGEPIPDFDFQVPGVTSISMDFHKYAYCPKGASVVLYRNDEIRKHQIFSYSGWPGYSVVNPTMQSSKSGGPMAACWAVLHHLGQDGYLRIAETLRNLSRTFQAGIATIPDLRVLGDPCMTLFAIGSETINIFRLGDELKRRGWTMHSQRSLGEQLPSLHINLIPLNQDRVEEFLAELPEAIAAVRSAGGEEASPMQQMLEQVDLESLEDDQIVDLLEMLGLGSGTLPGDDRAEIDEILDAISVPMTDRILTVYFNQLMRVHAETPDLAGVS